MESFYSAKKIFRKISMSEFVKHMLRLGNYSEKVYLEARAKLHSNSNARTARLAREARTGKRVCYKCRRLRLLEDFHLMSKTGIERKLLCRDCSSKRAKIRRAKAKADRDLENQNVKGVRKCRVCGETKSLVNFYKCRRRNDEKARDTICKSCKYKAKLARCKKNKSYAC